jgi:hypothetical protein
MNEQRRQFLVLVALATAATAVPFPAWAAEKMKIGIIGSGNVGGALGGSWVRAGHAVMFSSRHIEEDR